LSYAHDLALVLDIHHHFIKTGEYIEATDDRIKQVIDSWRGVQPVIHYSVSREDVLVGFSPDDRPSMESLLANGYKKAKLRAHSDYMWNRAVNDWALTHLSWADMMVESKCKNLASIELYNYANTISNAATNHRSVDVQPATDRTRTEAFAIA
jgi:UV DNA damage endonuclease